jgi:hypothetical protein
MKKIKSPWYGFVWIVLWTAALIYFLTSNRFNERESVGLFLVWLTFVGITAYLLIHHFRTRRKKETSLAVPVKTSPSLNAPCLCGSGKKYKRCCGAVDR